MKNKVFFFQLLISREEKNILTCRKNSIEFTLNVRLAHPYQFVFQPMLPLREN